MFKKKTRLENSENYESLEGFSIGEDMKITSIKVYVSEHETHEDGTPNNIKAKVALRINHAICMNNIRIRVDENNLLYVEFPYLTNYSKKNVEKYGSEGKRFPHFNFIGKFRRDAVNDYILDVYDRIMDAKESNNAKNADSET